MSTSEQRTPDRRLRRRAMLGGLVVLAVAALILTPPYVNVNRYRRRITTTMSQSLGRPVHLDNVSVHLLPVPGLTLSNLVVSEDPAFGYEPIIRANTVEATLRASSLWRRHVEFSTIRFIDPSVNLVRNAQGKWNLEDVLMQASHVETAPTAQRTAGPAPRFPYIEATGARMNVKLGDEKMPFSLTDTQFALWLPSPQIWRVRMRGRPTRTDSNVSQAGEMTLEGSLQRARTMADVPLNLRATWNGAPLGEASHLLTGNDAGWRGTVFGETRIAGRLGAASVTTHLQLNDLRRADFVPAQPLDVTVDCSSTADVERATLTNAACSVPIGEMKPLTLSAVAVDLENPKSSQAKITATNVPLPWAFAWAKLFAQGIPASLEPAGDINGELDWNIVSASWQGTLTAKPPSTSSAMAEINDSQTEAPTFSFSIDTSPTGGLGAGSIVRLAPTTLHPEKGASVTVAGQADETGYVLHLTGTATPSQLEAFAARLPPLNEGVASVFTPGRENLAVAPSAVAVDCARIWGSAQTCLMVSSPAAPKPARTKRRR